MGKLLNDKDLEKVNGGAGSGSKYIFYFNYQHVPGGAIYHHSISFDSVGTAAENDIEGARLAQEWCSTNKKFYAGKYNQANQSL